MIKKKVLFVSHSGKLSGANLSFYSIIKQLKDRLDITVLVNNLDSELVHALDEIDVKYIYIQYSWWVACNRKNPAKQIYRYCIDYLHYKKEPSKSKLKSILKNYGFDAIYTNTCTIDIGYKISRALQIPHVWHIREFGKEDFGFLQLTSNKKRKEAYESSEILITISKPLAETIKKRYPDSNVRIVYNGFDIQNLLFDNERIEKKDVINILVTGQVSEAKGQIQAAQAVALLNKHEVKFVLYLAGNVDESYKKCILNGDKCPPWLHFLGKVNDVYSLRKNMDIELVCSRSEAFGRVTIEAMLHSIPVIGADRGATNDLLKDGNGILYKYGDVHDLANKIRKLAEDEQLYSSIVRKASLFAQQFTIQKCADSIYKYIKTVKQ